MDVFQIYRQFPRIEKNSYTPEKRASLFNEIEIIKSTTGFVENKTLYLPQPINRFPGIENSSLIFIQDIQNYDQWAIERNLRDSNYPDWLQQNCKNAIAKNNLELIYFLQPSYRYFFEIFGISKKDNSTYEFHLEYERNQSKIGVPSRENHKIYDLSENKSFAYRINGKIDGYNQRTFLEFRYHITHLGNVDSIKFKALNKIVKTKKFDFNSVKTIDETKILK